jgi:O-antigen ligase
VLVLALRHMSNNAAKAVFILLGAILLLVGMLFLRPGYLSSSSGLTLLIGGEILLAAICNFRKMYLALVLLCFLVAGTGLPFRFELLQARWLVLAVGAVLGFAVYLKTHTQSFKAFHLVALFCTISAFVSALVSAFPSEAILKAASLLMLFGYVSAGARTAVNGDPERFFRVLVRVAEVLVLIAVLFYFVLGWQLFGNPNSLGAIMAVVAVPLLLWGQLTARSGPERLRLTIGLVCALVLLLSSFARAAIGASCLSSILVLVSLRRYRLLVKGIALAVVLAMFVTLFIPRAADSQSLDGSESLASTFIYKGKREQGVFGSRRGVWQQTWDVVREKPWFGSGFGTSSVTEDLTKLQYAEHHIDSWVIREHGNSYLAIIEWTGLLGVLPFYVLIGMALMYVRSACTWVRRTQDVFSPALPALAIVAAGLIDAAFEDWLFAVGYYLSVFFWVIAFALVDVMSSRQAVYAPAEAPIIAEHLLSAAAPAQ